MKKKKNKIDKNFMISGTEEKVKEKKEKVKDKKSLGVIKSIFKWLGIVFALIAVIIATGIGTAYFTGMFEQKNISINKLTWEQDQMVVTDDFYAQVNYEPKDAQDLMVNLELVSEESKKVIDLPKQVKAGEKFKITVKKDTNGNNIGGEAVIRAYSKLVDADTKLKVLVDVAIPYNGIIIASDCDSLNKNIANVQQNFNIYVFTNPSNALKPNMNLPEATELQKLHKNLILDWDNKNALSIDTNNVTFEEGFYCKHYKEANHQPIYPLSKGNICPVCKNNIKMEKIKYLKYKAKAKTGTLQPIKVTVNGFRTYGMQDDYVDKDDLKYIVKDENGHDKFNENLYFNDLGIYLNKYKNLIKLDGRKFTSGLITYNNGAEFIENFELAMVDKKEDNKNIKVEASENSDKTEEKEPEVVLNQKYIQYFKNSSNRDILEHYINISSESFYEIQDIDIKEVQINQTSGSKKFKLYEKVEYTQEELKKIYDIKLIPNISEVNSSILDYRIPELRIECIKDKNPHVSGEYEVCGDYFEIQNPNTLDENPIWSITPINTISIEDINRHVRFRVYLESQPKLGATIEVGVETVDVVTFDWKLQHNIQQNMVTNEKGYGKFKQKQELFTSSLNITTQNNNNPTFNKIIFFVDDSVTVQINGATFYQIKLNEENSNITPHYFNDIHGAKALYEIANYSNNKLWLEALNVPNGENLRIYAGIIKTNMNGMPIDSEGNWQFIANEETGELDKPNDLFLGYQILKLTSPLEIKIEHYLEEINFYTKHNADEFIKRNYSLSDGGVEVQLPILKLLAGYDYKFYATGFNLETIEIESVGLINKKNNIQWAMDKNSQNISFKYGSDNIFVPSRYIKDSGMFEMQFTAPVNKNQTSNSNIVDRYDFKSFINDKNMSTMSLAVYYADFDINSFLLSTNYEYETNDVLSKDVDGVNYYETLIQEMETLSVDGENEYSSYWHTYKTDKPSTHDVKLLQAGNSQLNKAEKFKFKMSYGLDIEKDKPLEDGTEPVNKTGKIDDYFIKEKDYILTYINRILDPEIVENFSCEFKTSFVDPKYINQDVNNYLTIDYKIQGTEIIPNLHIIKGLIDGIEIKIDCIIGLYKLNNGEYLKTQKQTLILNLKQAKIEYQFFNPVKKDDNGAKLVKDSLTTDNKFDLIPNSLENPLIINPLANDLVENLNGKESFNLLSYVPTINSNRRFINVQISNDAINNIGYEKYCTFQINEYNGIKPGCFIKDGKDIGAIAKPKIELNGSDAQLLFRPYLLNEDVNATITVKSPFGSDTETYYIKILRGIVVNDSTMPNEIGAGEEINLTQNIKIVKGDENPRAIFEIVNEQAKQFASIYQYIPNGESSTNNIEDYILKTSNVLEDTIVPIQISIILDNNLKIYVGKKDIKIKQKYNIVLKNEENIKIINAVNFEGKKLKADILEELLNTDNAEEPKLIIKENLSTINKTDIINLNLLTFKINGIINNTLLNEKINPKIDKNGVLIMDYVDGEVDFAINIYKNIGLNQEISFKEVRVKIKSPIVFNINKNLDAYGEYDSDNNFGHTFSVKSPELIKPNEYVVNNDVKNVVLFDAKNIENSILQFNLLNMPTDILKFLYKDFTLFIYSDIQNDYVENNNIDNFELLITKSATEVEKIILQIKKAVNNTVRYKIKISTINNYSGNYEYYFTLKPQLNLVVNYPLNSVNNSAQYEIVNAEQSQIDMSNAYINEKARIGFKFNGAEFNNYEIINSIYNIKNETTKIITNYKNLFKFKLLDKNGILDKSGIVNINSNNIITFNANKINTNFVDKIVRVYAFDENYGVYIDYKFRIYKTIPTIKIEQSAKNTTIYSGRTYNLADFVSINNPNLAYYVFKYKGNDNLVKYNNKFIKTNDVLVGNNAGCSVDIIEISEQKQISFEVYNTFSVSPNKENVIINLTIKPNIELIAGNIATDNRFIAGREYTFLADDSLKIDESLQVYKFINSIGDYTLKFKDKTEELSMTEGNRYKIKFDYVANECEKVLVLSKVVNETTISLEIKIIVVPDVTFHIKYKNRGESSQKFYGSDPNDITEVNLFNKVENNTLFGFSNYGDINMSANKIGTEYVIRGLKNQLFITDSQYLISGVGVTPRSTEINQVEYVDFIFNLDSELKFTVPSVNKRLFIPLQIGVVWHNDTITFTDFVMEIEPYVFNSNILYDDKTSKNNSLTVMSASTIGIGDQTKNSQFTLSQGKNQALFNGQYLGKNGSKPSNFVNIVFKDTNFSETNNEYEIKSSYIKFGVVYEPKTIEIPFYYDLTGKLKGVVSQNNVESLYREFIGNNPLKLKVTLLPTLDTIRFQNDSNSPTTKEKAKNLSDNFNNYRNEIKSEASPKTVQTLITDNGQPIQSTTVSSDINQYLLSGENGLLTFEPTSNSTFSNTSDKINCDFSLYLDDLNKNMEVVTQYGVNSILENSKEYFKLSISANGKNLFLNFVPPYFQTVTTFYFNIKLSLPGVKVIGGINNVLDLWFTYQTIEENGTVYNSEILEIKELKNIKLMNNVGTINIDEYFKIGQLLLVGNYTINKDPERFKKIDNKYYYLLNSVPVSEIAEVQFVATYMKNDTKIYLNDSQLKYLNGKMIFNLDSEINLIDLQIAIQVGEINKMFNLKVARS